MSAELYAPNQQVVRGDGSGPAEEGGGGSPSVDAPEPEPKTDGFDPADATVEEVKTYVEAYPDETEQILSAERSGKNRSTLVDWLEERLG